MSKHLCGVFDLPIVAPPLQSLPVVTMFLTTVAAIFQCLVLVVLCLRCAYLHVVWIFICSMGSVQTERSYLCSSLNLVSQLATK